MSIPKIFSVSILLMVGALTSSIRAAEGHLDVSRIIDKAAAESILETPVNPSTPRNVEGKDGYYSKCNYYSATPGKSLIIRVYQAAEGFSPYKELDQVVESSGSMRAISGLGDKARISSGPSSGLSANVVMLYVIKANSLVTVGLGGVADEAAAQEKVKDVAQKILAEL